MHKCKAGIVMVLLFLLVMSPSYTASAQEKLDSRKVLLLYSTFEQKVNEEVRIMDVLLGHFSKEVITQNIQKLEGDPTLRGITHIVYVGLEKEKINKEAIDYLVRFKGPVYGLGYNTDQFPSLKNTFQMKQEVSVERLLFHQPSIERELDIEQTFFNITPNATSKVVMNALYKGSSYPAIIQDGPHMYAATHSLNEYVGPFIGESLFDFFKQERERDEKVAYLRLEDVHPLSDPKKLMDIAVYLKEQNVPYMITVIPVYQNPKTKVQYHMLDSPKVVKALKYMQENGASIVLHGYTHQYRDHETGEGFEFWDVDNNAPIFAPKDQNNKVKREADFATFKEYQEYVKKGKAYEKKYMTTKITKGVQELNAHDLISLAFEAPHYTMSQNGYSILSNHFSTYIGQVQVSDDTWKHMYSPTYTSYPGFMNDMKLIPETLGYVEHGELADVHLMLERADYYKNFSDTVLGGFYHPFLGVDLLKEYVEGMNKIEGIKWFDLKSEPNEVSVSNVTIISDEGAVVVADESTMTTYKAKNLLSFFQRNFLLAAGGIAIFAIVSSLVSVMYIRRKTMEEEGHFD
ncbi:polysaccharide deacetylase family protein [Metabacillus iocasae]|uniref:Uncharacterized protein YdaL n=1 Tax=Priestia iocasae TaxID=2291674 RepID=A0ABS2QSH0_9BACI|nr:polysaccharide deacetylase family protein [Metabacillus iocasae]MBM7702396.1 uncharacterized protein YdaL [Metabacillus iocasae]